MSSVDSVVSICGTINNRHGSADARSHPKDLIGENTVPDSLLSIPLDEVSL